MKFDNQAIYYDQYGLIVHKNGDGSFNGGDTAQREGWYWLGVWIRQHTPGLEPWKPTRVLTFDQVLDLLEPAKDGVFYRHPKQAPYNNPYDKRYGTSRDQLIPLVAAMGVWGKTDAIRRLWNALPEDLLGKHSFNGNWRNFLGEDGEDCTSITKRDCSPSGACNLQVDNRDCSLKVDTLSCPLPHDNRDCSLHVDTRSCGHDISLPFHGHTHVNDPLCEAAKSAQNSAYAAQKATCETAKSGQNAAYAATKAACEGEKSSQNAIFAAAKTACETQKESQNAAFASQKASCELAKSSGKAACEIGKQADFQRCRMTNVFSGDLIGPEAVNLFCRAVNEDPIVAQWDFLTPTIIQGGMAGESELLVNAYLRVAQTQHDRDDVGDDLNHIVELLLAKIKFPSQVSDEAARVYAEERPYSYGSYLGTYYATYGDNFDNQIQRLENGIRSGWKPDASPAYGAVRWYHRPNVGANPELAVLYSVIIDHYLK